MITDLISVIIPAYNAESYLRECLDSVISQTYSNIEIILIDDGSTDGTGSICDRYAELDSRICVQHQENFGAAISRKKGIHAAKGKYICFVDADDWIDSTMIEYMAENIGNCDLITTNCYREREDGTQSLWRDAFAAEIYEDEESLHYFWRNFITFNDRMKDGILPFLVTKMYKKDIADAVIESVDLNMRYAEDRDFLFQYILKCRSICVTQACFYHYRVNSDSVTQSINKNFMNDLNNLYLSLERVFRQHPAERELMHQLQLFIMSRIDWIPSRMGFDREVIEMQLTRYAFPFYDLIKGKKLILYGASVIGVDYYHHIKQKNDLDLVLWVDKNWENYQDMFAGVVSPKCLEEAEFDYIIIAVKSPRTAQEIKMELRTMGVLDNKMLWEKPSRM